MQSYPPTPYGPVYGPMPYTPAQAPPQMWDWRDYFVSCFVTRPYVELTNHQITAVVSGTVAYGAAALFRVRPFTARFLSPTFSLSPEICLTSSKTPVGNCI